MGVAERRQREKQERRSDILDAAERVFLEKGLAVATMDEIAQAAEVSKGTLYLYFKGKDELYLTIAMRSLRQLLEAFDAVARDGGSGFDRLRRLMHAHARFASEHRDRFRVATSWIASEYSVSDDSALFDEYKALIRRVFTASIEAIEAGRADGTIRRDIDPHRLAFQLWGSTHGVLMLRTNAAEVARRSPANIDLEVLVPTFIDLLLTAVQAQPSRKPE